MTGGETHPRGESPGGRLRTCGLGPTCPLTWAEAGGWSARAVGCGTPSAAPPAPLHSLWAAVIRTWLWAARENRHKAPYPLTPPQPGLYAFSSPAHQARKGAAPSATLVRGPGWPEASRREGQSSALGQGWGQTFLLTFLLCDQAHQDPDGVLIGVLGPVGRVDPWRRERTTMILGKKWVEHTPGSPATPRFGSRGRRRPGCARLRPQLWLNCYHLHRSAPQLPAPSSPRC